MGSFSIWHWLIVLVIVVMVFGTKKLKNVGSDLGAAVKGFKDGMKGAAEDTGPTTTTTTAVPPQQVGTTHKATDPNTVDVEARTKS